METQSRCSVSAKQLAVSRLFWKDQKAQALTDPPPLLPPQVVQDNELGALTEALDGQYVEPGPGGDPIRNPLVLPTGKNIHALDPQSIPTQAALKSARLVVDKLLDREKINNGGEFPETIALVLWGTDNIKTYGESLAQVGFQAMFTAIADIKPAILLSAWQKFHV